MPDPEAEPRLASTAADDVVDALDGFDAADHAFQRRTREAMRMGETDLRALRFLIMARADGRVVSARELADHLGLAASSATTVIDRLTARGHVRRAAHPSDRRRVAIEVIDGDIAQTLSPTGHERMLAAASTLSASEAEQIVAFFDRLSVKADPTSA